MVQECEVTEVDIDGRSFMVRPVGSWVLESGNVVAEALAVSLDKPLEAHQQSQIPLHDGLPFTGAQRCGASRSFRLLRR